MSCSSEPQIIKETHRLFYFSVSGVYKTIFETKFDFPAIFLKRFQKSFSLILLFRYYFEQVNQNTFKSQFRPVHWTMALAGALLFNLAHFHPECQLWLITLVRALHHLMHLPRPTTTEHTSRLSNRTASFGGLTTEKLQYVFHQSERILEECHQFHQINSIHQRYQIMIGRSKLN